MRKAALRSYNRLARDIRDGGRLFSLPLAGYARLWLTAGPVSQNRNVTQSM